MKNNQTNTTSKTRIIITDASDILLINLTSKNQVKPASVQDRILRRILEKRQAQTNHRRNKAMVPSDLERLNWEDSLYDSQIVYNFASQTSY